MTVFLAYSTFSKGPCNSKLVWNPVFLGPLLCLVEGGSPNPARLGCRGQSSPEKGLEARERLREAAGRGTEDTVGPRTGVLSLGPPGCCPQSVEEAGGPQKGSQEPWVPAESRPLPISHLNHCWAPANTQLDDGILSGLYPRSSEECKVRRFCAPPSWQGFCKIPQSGVAGTV